MLANDSLPGELDGIESLNWIFNWEKIRNKIQDIKNLGARITARQYSFVKAKELHLKAGRKTHAKLVDDLIEDTHKDLANYWKMMGYIDTYLPEWIQASKGSSGVSGLGIIITGPVAVLGAASVAAIAYVASEWSRLDKKYIFKGKIIEAVKDLTAEEAGELLREESKNDLGPLGMLTGNMTTIVMVVGGVLILSTLLPTLMKARG